MAGAKLRARSGCLQGGQRNSRREDKKSTENVGRDIQAQMLLGEFEFQETRGDSRLELEGR